MDVTTTVVLLGAVVIALIVIGWIGLSRLGAAERPMLMPLSRESLERYMMQWGRIESHFIDSPEESVQAADALLLDLLGERQHPLSNNQLPSEMRRARREAGGRRGTEGMRQALLHYRVVMEDYARPDEGQPQPRRQVAS